MRFLWWGQQKANEEELTSISCLLSCFQDWEFYQRITNLVGEFVGHTGPKTRGNVCPFQTVLIFRSEQSFISGKLIELN